MRIDLWRPVFSTLTLFPLWLPRPFQGDPQQRSESALGTRQEVANQTGPSTPALRRVAQMSWICDRMTGVAESLGWQSATFSEDPDEGRAASTPAGTSRRDARRSLSRTLDGRPLGRRWPELLDPSGGARLGARCGLLEA